MESFTAPVGLCETCKNMRRVTSDRGSVFYLCKLSAVDPRYPKYPPLPVLACDGYENPEHSQAEACATET
ncbi:MAG TPA: hypothetical protein VEU96_32800 [Bryobacteraceae bacterium]|nr:hypothetical protein [Bryobacteraceae bacterium]